ncbi:RHS repeat-associated core domain-containing protein [Pseudomonas sp. Marseille-Q5115]|uniref:RHS repeat-associated core domain-containing protein n=1 Tax=Pseudomonas sp. Marseille-Q5115 TaxID=2866593 RepID=UPI001CE3BF85|nr:RHS repeat-associated core domain-containing protein [Pseudomonas sp. Marseille-Q5115]
MTRIALTITDLPGSVLAQYGYPQRFAYTPFGGLPVRIAGASAYHSLWLEDGYYLPGNGYRAYSPQLLRFYAPDSWSPFREGGMNAYAYCRGEPINHADHTGHAPFNIWRKLLGALRGKRKQGLTSTSSQQSITSGIANPDFVDSQLVATAPSLPPKPPANPLPLPSREPIGRLDKKRAVVAPPVPHKAPIKPVRQERAKSPETTTHVQMRRRPDGTIEWEFEPEVWTAVKR